jgi:hypothetical protein
MRFPRNTLIEFTQRRQAVLGVSEIPTGTGSTLFLETNKYGLRLKVSDNTPIRIESIRKRLYEAFAGDDDEPPKVTPRRGTGPIFTQFSYRLFPEWRTSYLW